MLVGVKIYNPFFHNMLQIHQLTFNPFAENTYLIEDENKNVMIIDPGMYGPGENQRFQEYIQHQGLKPVRLLLTHAHLDHVFGVDWVCKTYGLKPELHKDDAAIYNSAQSVALQYGLQMGPLPEVVLSLESDGNIAFGGTDIQCLFTPGHSPGSISFYNKQDQWLIGGDVLFQGSIGRTDLPGGDYQTLIDSITTKFMSLPDNVVVYSGHGPMTNIGQERISNPFLQD